MVLVEFFSLNVDRPHWVPDRILKKLVAPFVFAHTVMSVGCWLGHQTCKNRPPYNLYCVGADVKPCSIKLHHALTLYHASTTSAAVYRVEGRARPCTAIKQRARSRHLYWCWPVHADASSADSFRVLRCAAQASQHPACSPGVRLLDAGHSAGTESPGPGL